MKKKNMKQRGAEDIKRAATDSQFTLALLFFFLFSVAAFHLNLEMNETDLHRNSIFLRRLLLALLDSMVFI